VTAGTTKDFIQANGRTWGVMEATSNTYFHHDAIGSVVALSNESGQVTDTYEYEPFGKVLDHQGTSTNDYQFVGGYGVRKLNDTLDTMGVRQYSEMAGRFTTQDPLGMKGGLNYYKYAQNTPLSLIDNSGLFTTIIITAGDAHAGLHIDNSGAGVLFDPAGGYHDKVSQTGDVFYGTDASLGSYLGYESSTSKEVTTYTFNTTKDQECEIANRLEDVSSVTGGWCAYAISTTLSGIGPFANLGTSMFPSSLANDLSKIGGVSVKKIK
jgi:RHS repeat-associated protein